MKKKSISEALFMDRLKMIEELLQEEDFHYAFVVGKMDGNEMKLQAMVKGNPVANGLMLAGLFDKKESGTMAKVMVENSERLQFHIANAMKMMEEREWKTKSGAEC